MLQYMLSQKVGHAWATELNWKKMKKNQQKNWHEKTLDTTGAAYMTQKHQSPDQKLDTS